MDQLTRKRIKKLHPKLRDEAICIIDDIDRKLTGRAICRFSHTLRTHQEQNDLYAIGRTKPGSKVTNAKGGDSYHNYGLAVDVVLLVDRDGNGTYESASWETATDFDDDTLADWLEIVAVFKSYGWEWGGDWTRFKDMPHFQKTFGLSIAECKRRYSNGYINI